jgi:hypothetical protein
MVSRLNKLRTEAFYAELATWTKDTTYDTVVTTKFTRKVELMDIYEKMKWVHDHDIFRVTQSSESPLQAVERDILAFTNGNSGIMKCEIDGLPSKALSDSVYLKLAKLFVPIFDAALLSNKDDAMLSELHVTPECLIDNDTGECSVDREIIMVQFKSVVTCRACRRRLISHGSECIDVCPSFWEKFVNRQYAASIIENSGDLVGIKGPHVNATCYNMGGSPRDPF